MRTKSRTEERRARLVASALVSVALLGSAPVFADEGIDDELIDDKFVDHELVDDVPDVRLPAVTKFPAYPPIARRDRIEGEVTVCFTIAPDGRIVDAEIASSTDEIFEEPALEAIQASSFEPLATGEAVSEEPVCRTYRFRLDPVEPEEEVAADAGSSVRSSV